MTHPSAFAAVIVCTALAGCGGEEEHHHDAGDFASHDDCEAHYEEEGHSADEIEDLCAGVT